MLYTAAHVTNLLLMLLMLHIFATHVYYTQYVHDTHVTLGVYYSKSNGPSEQNLLHRVYLWHLVHTLSTKRSLSLAPVLRILNWHRILELDMI